MRHAYGKPTGLVARVDIGQIILSVRAKEQHKAAVIEALRRAKYKFPGRQNVYVSNKWGFTSLTHEQFQKYKTEGRLVINGIYAKRRPCTGRLKEASILTF